MNHFTICLFSQHPINTFVNCPNVQSHCCPLKKALLFFFFSIPSRSAALRALSFNSVSRVNHNQNPRANQIPGQVRSAVHFSFCGWYVYTLLVVVVGIKTTCPRHKPADSRGGEKIGSWRWPDQEEELLVYLPEQSRRQSAVKCSL